VKRWLYLLIASWLAIGNAFGFAPARSNAAGETVEFAELPKEAQQTLRLIQSGGPFPYSRDGIVFGNFEKRLPRQPRGYYREYTVRTPWLRDRGPRRIIQGTGGELYYTDDHYQSFRRIEERRRP